MAESTGQWDPHEARAVTSSHLLFVTPGLIHDIGNCLQAASLYLELLKIKLRGADSCAPEDASAIALSEQLLRIHQLVSALVDTAAPIAAAPTKFDLRHLVSDTTQLLTVALKHRRITLHLGLGDAELQVAGDRPALMHACLALMISAMDLKPEGGDLNVTCNSGRSGFARVQVGDTGSGLPEQSATKLLGVRSTERERRLGPGLSFSSSVIRHHAGSLLSADDSDGGSVFWFELPLLGVSPKR